MSLYQKYLATINKWLWKEAQYDAYYNNQCTDFVKQYAKDMWYPITTFWNAKDFATIWLGKNWVRVTDDPWIWDIVVQPRGQYGHIAVIEDIEWDTLVVYEQNRDGKASATSKGSPVWLGKYKIRFDEVYFRMKVKPTKSTNIAARKDYDFKNYPILDQGNSGDCTGFATLACLIRMKDWVDYKKIAMELIAEKGNELSIRAASNWFIRKKYIKWIRKASYKKSLMKRQPLITSLKNVNWENTNKPPYILNYDDRELVWGHMVCLSNGVIANSHWANRYDKWYCYYTEEQREEKMKVFYTLII